jgi:dTDP-glucose 4,6-dehydratase/UDP-glucose 4-epimerase
LIALDAKVTLVDSLIPLYGGNIFNIHDIRGEVTINLGDVRDPHALTHLVKGQDYLFNLAGQTSHLDSMEDPETDQRRGAAVHSRNLSKSEPHCKNRVCRHPSSVRQTTVSASR